MNILWCRDINEFILGTHGPIIRTGENSACQCCCCVVEDLFDSRSSGIPTVRFPRHLPAPSLPLSRVGGRGRQRLTRARREGDVHRQAPSKPARVVASTLPIEWRNHQRTHSAGSGFLAQKEGLPWQQNATETLSWITFLTGSKGTRFPRLSSPLWAATHPINRQRTTE